MVELGPLAPERVLFPSEAQISEFLPGDRVRLEVVVVDPSGLPLEDAALDSVWLHCGAGPCQGGSENIVFADPVYDQPCDELDDWTTDSRCRLGEGRGGIEFTTPALGEGTLTKGDFAVYAVVAWNGQRAEDCWSTRRVRGVIAPDCGFVRFDGSVGPYWTMLVHAESEGLSTPFATTQLPAAVYAQQANRAPVVDHVELAINGEAQAPVEVAASSFVGPVSVEPGDVLDLTVVADPNEQLAQLYFNPWTPSADAFTVVFETLWLRVSTAGALTFDRDRIEGPALLAMDSIELQVHDAAGPGTARVVLVTYDMRGAEDVLWLELEIQ
ncbi:hypothetical protein ENSA5_06100 [Enhygromyxa salina]|uniref:Uncharacterized protein n=1 Tax=Enhygromyxa salina TaxID=215803 RepID=A0A2S9YHK9_9BACT|nr:hypothetical protein ENSA5_06100 [Enhygromyxa salina]